MPNTTPQDTPDTNASEIRRGRFEAAWLARQADEPAPDWRQHLPADEELCSPDLIFFLLQVDIECRVKAGLPALLTERYFEHPRLQQEDARQDAERQMELIRWEYQQRWNQRDQAQRADYEAAFPQHAAAVRELKPRLDCPRCRRTIVLEETWQTICCPECGPDAPLDGHFNPFVAATPTPLQFDSREYQLVEQLGEGGMGEVYCAGDPALGRKLAVKVMKSKYRGNAGAEHRFLREARVTGSLQHPGIVPVHNLGRLADGRLHYTMRLVRGQTFADILKDEAGKPERLPNLLNIFEKICQAVAYAHSKRVIHRDLKPANVMAGRFGVVQVMDWGLAKLLTSGAEAESEGSPDAAGTRIHTESDDTPVDLSRMGSGFGTPAYMSQEQALGEWDTVDERADVFSLGSILCEMLTGKPAYTGKDSNEMERRAKHADLGETLERLTQCGADTALTALSRECLSPKSDDRPRDAYAVAKRVADYQAEVQERLRQAELERVAAEARAQEEQARAIVEQERTREALARVKAERRARQRTLALAAAVVVFVLAGVAGLTVGLLAVQAEQRRTHAVLDQVTAEQEKTQAALTAETMAWKRTREALNTLTDEVMEELLGKQAVLGEKEKAYLRKALGFYEEFAAASGDTEESQAVAAEGQFRVAKLRAFLGENAEAEHGYRAAVRLYEKLAGDFPAAPQYRQDLGRSHHNLGILLADRGKHAEAEVAYRQALALQEKLAAEFPAVPLYRHYMASNHAALGYLLLRRGKHAEAEEAYHTALTLQEKLVVEFPAEPLYRRELAYIYIELGYRLRDLGKGAEAEVAYRQALALQEKLVGDFPAVPLYRQQLANGHHNLGLLLRDLGKGAEAEVAYRQALALQEKLVGDFPAVPGYSQQLAYSHNNLGYLLHDLGKYAAAEAAYRQAISLQEKLVGDFPAVLAYRQGLADSHNGLGYLLRDLGKYAAAEAAYRQALALQEKLVGDFPAVPAYSQQLAHSHNGLGLLLADLGKYAAAEAAYRQALALRKKLASNFPASPTYCKDLAGSYVNIGNLFRDRGQLQVALDLYGKAMPLLQSILAQDARLATARLFLRNTHWGRARALDQLGRHVEAAKDWLRAAELDDGRERMYFLAHAGDHRAAVKAVEELLASADPKGKMPPSGFLLYNAASIYALSSAAVKDDAKLRQKYGVRVIALLRQAQVAGFFKDPKEVEHIKKDTDFDALRQLDDFKKLIAELEAAALKAPGLKPNDAIAYYNLGTVLNDQGKHVEAEAVLLKAIALKPNYAEAYANLSSALNGQRKNAEAEAAARKAIALKPALVEGNGNLGIALGRQGKDADAEAAFREVIALKPDYANAYFNLAGALGRQGKPVEAEAAYRKAIALKPDYAIAYFNLGTALNDQEKQVEAEAAYRKAIAINPDYAEVYCNLGSLLQSRGRFKESLSAFQRGHELGSKQPGWRYPSLQWVSTAERFVELEKKLPAILTGEATPANPGEAVALASMCQQPYKKRYAASARLYADAFTAEPRLAPPNRYNAACSAALAAAGQREDARLLPDKVAAMFHHWALGWLRDDLMAYAKLSDRHNPQANKVIQQRLAHWRSDPDLVSVRDAQALDRLADNERAAWQALWHDVDELAKRVAKQDAANK